MRGDSSPASRAKAQGGDNVLAQVASISSSPIYGGGVLTSRILNSYESMGMYERWLLRNTSMDLAFLISLSLVLKNQLPFS